MLSMVYFIMLGLGGFILSIESGVASNIGYYERENRLFFSIKAILYFVSGLVAVHQSFIHLLKVTQ